jgi:hypothetical protein
VITTLRFLGYDGILSLEMENEYMDIQEGLEKAAAFIRPMILEKPKGLSWWQVAELGTVESNRGKGIIPLVVYNELFQT